MNFDYNNTFFTSDWHFNHANICRGTTKWDKGYRDFDSLEQMNDTLINNCNEVVPRDGVLFMLGDVIFGDKKVIGEFLDRINCRTIHLIYGNHDDYIRKGGEYITDDCVKNCQKLFTSCQDKLEIYVGKKLVVLDHYAHRIWRDSHHGSYMLYGHSHATLPDDPNLLSIDCGVDTKLFGHKQFYPYSFAEIDYIMKNNKRLVSIDHHTQTTN